MKHLLSYDNLRMLYSCARCDLVAGGGPPPTDLDGCPGFKKPPRAQVVVMELADLIVRDALWCKDCPVYRFATGILEYGYGFNKITLRVCRECLAKRLDPNSAPTHVVALAQPSSSHPATQPHHVLTLLRLFPGLEDLVLEAQKFTPLKGPTKR